jgi:hypothetical protein
VPKERSLHSFFFFEMPLDVFETLEVDMIDGVNLDEALEAMLTSSLGFSTNYF